MTEYICERCTVYFKDKRQLIKHLKRKKPCIEIESEIEREELIERLNKKEGKECERCKKIYKNDESLRKHKCKGEDKEINKINERLDRLEEENKRINNENKELKEKIKGGVVNNITNNTDNSTNNTNIMIVMPNSFGKENLEELLKNPEKEIIKLLRGNCPESIVNLVKEIHKNPKHPENNNIRIENKKEGIISIYENNEWRDHSKTNGLQRIYDNTELKVLEILDASDEDIIKKHVKPRQIERFNEETDVLGWADMIDIRKEEEKPKGIEFIESKEQKMRKKQLEKRNEKKQKEMENLLLHTMSKKENIKEITEF